MARSRNKGIYDIFEYYSNKEPYKTFITKNCYPMQNVRTNTISLTNIPLQMFSQGYWEKIPFLSKEYSTSLKYTGKAVVYAFYIPKVDKFYIGSAVNCNNRLYMHYSDCFDPNRGKTLFYEDVKSIGGFDQVKWTLIKTCPDYYKLFYKEYPNLVNDLEWARNRENWYSACLFLTQFNLYTYDQACQSYKKGPRSYHNKKLKFPVSWTPNAENKKGTTRPILA